MLRHRICTTEEQASACNEEDFRDTRKAYETQRILESMDSMVRLINPFYFSFMLVTCGRYYVGVATWPELQAASVIGALVYASILLSLQQMKSIATRNMAANVALQTYIYMAEIMVGLSLSVMINDSVLKHRMFLTFQLTVTACYSIVGYSPPHVFALICSYNFLIWATFHWTANFWNAPCIIFGLLHSLLTFYLYILTDRRALKEFEAVQALDADRQYLQAMHATMQGMLASLFDASGTCDERGTVHSQTPQLEDLLVGHGQWDPSLQLCSFAASELEASRLQHFLEQVAQNECHRAQAIQVSLRTSRLLRSKATGTIEVKLFGIVLPARAGSPGVTTSKRIFIGLQAQENSTTAVPDSCHDTVVFEKVDPELQQDFLESHDDGAASTLGSLSYTKGHSTCSDAGTYYSHRSKQLQHRSVASGHQSTEDSSSQTETSALLCPHCYLPRPLQASTKFQNRLPNPRPQKTKGKKTQIQLNSKERVLNAFAETPADTVLFSLMEMLRVTNARGRGCCGYHITLARLAQIVKNISSGPCLQDFVIFTDWQCSICKAMNTNEDNEDGDDDGPIFCGVCGRPQQKHQLSSSESSNHGDLEDARHVSLATNVEELSSDEPAN